MRRSSFDNKSFFWIQIVEKLNTAKSSPTLFCEILKESCEYFGLGGTFFYEADPHGTFYLKHNFATFEGHTLHKTIAPDATLSSSLFLEISGKNIVSFNKNTKKTPLEDGLSELFKTNLLILIPILDQKNVIIAMVGFIDRRDGKDFTKNEFGLINAILGSIANHIKMNFFQERVVGTQKALESILDNMGVDIYVNDFYTHEILYANKSMAKPYGGKENMLGKKCWSVLYNDKTEQCDYCPQKNLLDENGNPTKTYSWDYQRPFDHAWFRVVSSTFKWVDGRLAHVVSSVDITENKRNEEIVSRMAEYDMLTGLPNRRKLLHDYTALFTNLEKEQEFFIFFFDLDGFKAINDTLGHGAGDELLVKVGDTLRKSPLIGESIYRHAGDEFIILLNSKDLDRAFGVIDILQSGFIKNFINAAADQIAECGASVGIVHYPSDADTLTELLHNADIAMYESKRKGKSMVHFYNQGELCTPEEYAKKHQFARKKA